MSKTTKSAQVHCVVMRRGEFINDGKSYTKGDPITVSRDVFELYRGTHLQHLEDIPDPTAATDEQE